MKVKELRKEIAHGKFAGMIFSLDELDDIVREYTDWEISELYPHGSERHSKEWGDQLVGYYSNYISPISECVKRGSGLGKYFHDDDPRNWEDTIVARHNPENKYHDSNN
jgi:hypothetical protein